MQSSIQMEQREGAVFSYVISFPSAKANFDADVDAISHRPNRPSTMNDTKVMTNGHRFHHRSVLIEREHIATDTNPDTAQMRKRHGILPKKVRQHVTLTFVV